MQRLTSLLFALALSTLGCKKHDATPPTQPPPPVQKTCLISQFLDVPTSSQAPTVAADFTYDNNDRLIRIDEGTNVAIYDYTSDGVIVTHTSSGVFNGKTVITNNKDGLATNVRSASDPGDQLWFNTSYEYNGQELARSGFTNFTMPDTIFTTYSWSGGNLISATTGTITDTYTYYTDQPRQQGDYQFFLQYIQGYETYRTKNLIKSGSGLSYTYEFTPEGRIGSVTASPTSGNPVLYKYNYLCK